MLHKAVFLGHGEVARWLVERYPETAEVRDWVSEQMPQSLEYLYSATYYCIHRRLVQFFL